MARRKPKSRRKTTPARTRRTPVKTGAKAAEPQAKPAASTADLTETYGYVRRDLMRIAVLGMVMFAIIFASPFILK